MPHHLWVYTQQVPLRWYGHDQNILNGRFDLYPKALRDMLQLGQVMQASAAFFPCDAESTGLWGRLEAS